MSLLLASCVIVIVIVIVLASCVTCDRIAYEEVLSTMVGALGDQPQDVLRGAADEVLAWLKVRQDRQREGSGGDRRTGEPVCLPIQRTIVFVKQQLILSCGICYLLKDVSGNERRTSPHRTQDSASCYFACVPIYNSGAFCQAGADPVTWDLLLCTWGIGVVL